MRTLVTSSCYLFKLWRSINNMQWIIYLIGCEMSHKLSVIYLIFIILVIHWLIIKSSVCQNLWKITKTVCQSPMWCCMCNCIFPVEWDSKWYIMGILYTKYIFCESDHENLHWNVSCINMQLEHGLLIMAANKVRSPPCFHTSQLVSGFPPVTFQAQFTMLQPFVSLWF